jgi:tetratricopeptide (TPR) repeat protein
LVFLTFSKFKQGHIQESQRLFEQILTTDKTFLFGVEYLALIYRRLSDVESSSVKSASIRKLNSLSYELMKVSRKRPEPWFVLGVYYDTKEDHEKAIQLLEVAISIDPLFSLAYQVKGKICCALAAEDSDDAAYQDIGEDSIICFRRAIDLCEDDVGAVEGLVLAHIHAFPKSPRYKEAIFQSQKIYQRMSSNPYVEVMLGNVLSMSRAPKTRDKARTLFKNALKRHRQQGSNGLTALLGLIQLYITDKDFNAAKEQIEYQIDKSTRDHQSGSGFIPLSSIDLATLYCKLGSVYSQMEKYELSLDAYHKALSISPEQNWPSAFAGMEEVQDKLGVKKSENFSASPDADMSPAAAIASHQSHSSRRSEVSSSSSAANALNYPF